MLVGSYPTVSPLPTAGPKSPRVGGLLSVALSIGSPRLGVTQRHALWSPDFPQLLPAATVSPTHRGMVARSFFPSPHLWGDAASASQMPQGGRRRPTSDGPRRDRLFPSPRLWGDAASASQMPQGGCRRPTSVTTNQLLPHGSVVADSSARGAEEGGSGSEHDEPEQIQSVSGDGEHGNGEEQAEGRKPAGQSRFREGKSARDVAGDEEACHEDHDLHHAVVADSEENDEQQQA